MAVAPAWGPGSRMGLPAISQTLLLESSQGALGIIWGRVGALLAMGISGGLCLS